MESCMCVTRRANANARREAEEMLALDCRRGDHRGLSESVVLFRMELTFQSRL